MLENFRASLADQDVSPRSIESYVSDITAFFNAAGHNDPAMITTPGITAYRKQLVAAGRKPATINRALIALRRYLDDCLKRGLIPDNPAAPVRLLDQVAPPPRQLTDHEIRVLLAAARKYGGRHTLRDTAIITLFLHTGLRREELINLRPEDIQLSERKGTLIVRSGKGGKRREIPLNATARGAAQTLLSAEFPQIDRLIPLTPRAINAMLQRYSHHARIDLVTPHDLRHAFGYRMYRATKDIRALADLMGHSDIKTTMRYTQQTEADIRAAVDSIAWE